MTDHFTDRTTDFDGSGAPVTATGDITIHYSGNTDGAAVTLFAKLSAADDYTPVYRFLQAGWKKISLPADATYYAVMRGAGPATSVSLVDNT